VPGLFLDGAMTFFTILLLVFFQPVYQRLLAERIAEDDKVLNQSIEIGSNESEGQTVG
jgi:hypothetical protein